MSRVLGKITRRSGFVLGNSALLVLTLGVTVWLSGPRPVVPEVSGQFAARPAAPEFEGTGWLNTDKPLTLADLRGRIVLLDFWTLC